MLKKTFFGVLFAVFVSGVLIAGINFNVTKATDYGNSGKDMTIKPIADTFVDGKYHWENNGYDDILAVWAYGDKFISFTKFDLSTIPSSANIISAELFLHIVDYSVDSNDPSIIGAHSYSNNSWGEHDLSWDTVDWSALNETAMDTTEIYVDKLEHQVWFNWTIAKAVESAKGNFLTVVLMAENEIESIFFYSRETSLKPYLNITYTFSTLVGGIIWENTTWTLENSPYTITDTVQIPENVTLTIEPGVTVIRPTSGDMFLLHGRIEAHGTLVNKITFDGGGNSNFFSPKASTTTTFLNISYSIIRNGLSLWPPTGYSAYGSFSIRYCELLNLASYSYVWGYGKDVYIEYNTFMNTGGFEIVGKKVYIRYNLFVRNIGIVVQNDHTPPETIVKYNSFIDMSGIVLRLPPGYAAAAMTATENYWGTNDTKVIDALIYDKKDDITCAGFIEYLPILTKPHPDTPTLPLMANFTYSPSVLYTHRTVTFNASASFGAYSTIVNYTWDFGDGNNITLKTPIATYTYTMPGSYNVNLTVTDENGFKNSTTTSLMVLQDDGTPVTTDDYDSEWHVTDFTITLTATDHESGVAETYYRINNGPIETISTDGQPFITTESANNTLEYWSVDKAGNEELPRKILTEIKLDKSVPTTGIPSRMPEGDVQPNQEVKVSVNVTDLTSGVKSVRLSYTSNTSILEFDFPMTFNSTTELWEFSIQGQQANSLVKYKVVAYDNAGNYKVEDNSGQHYIYTVIPEFPASDTTSPAISVLSPENKTYTINDVPLTFTVSESTSWIGYSLNPQNNVTISGNTTLVGLSDGTHTITVYVNDTAGNTGASEIIYFSVETSEPEPFPTWIVAAIAVIVIFGTTLLIYFAKVKKVK